MTIDKESLRPAFEQWAMEKIGCDQKSIEKDDAGDYVSDSLVVLWQGWCAAFDSLGEPVATLGTFPKRQHQFAHPGLPDKTDRELERESSAVLHALYQLPEVKP